MAARKRGTMWGFTLNNPSQAELDSIRHPNLPTFVLSISHQQELAPTTGTLHVQGAIRTTQKDWTIVKKYLPRADIEQARNEDALLNYVKKKETSVPGTQYQWPEAINEIIDVSGTPTPPLRLEPVEILKVLARAAPFLSIEDEVNLNFTDEYQRFRFYVGYACREVPNFINKVLSPNLFANFKLIFAVIKDFVLEEDPDPEDRQTDILYTECMIE